MRYILPVILLVLFSGCDFGYTICVCNPTSSDIYIKTYPLVESLYEHASQNEILKRKIMQEGDSGIYKINAGDTLRIPGNLGTPQIENLPFTYIAIIKNADTLELKGKQEILAHLKQMYKKKNKAGPYFIDI